MNSRRLQRVVKLLSRLPGVGEKTAMRYALHLITTSEPLAHDLAASLAELQQHLRPCSICQNIAEIAAPNDEPICAICNDNKRDRATLCVVARVHDLLAIERVGAMRGGYFVLGKLLSPLDGIGPDELPIGKLLRRIEDGVTEVIVATPPSVDGEATALLLKRELETYVDKKGLKITRIASGVPHGGDLEFADPITMGRALAGRQTI